MTADPVVHVYVLGNFDEPGLTNVLAELGLEGKPLTMPVEVLEPALILIGPGHEAPAGYSDISFTPPPDAPPSVLRELLRTAMQNVVLQRKVAERDQQVARKHRQFKELNRIGIALSAEKDIERLQSFILTSMRQLTHADGASLWLKREDETGAKLFLASSQNHSIDKSTYSAFTVPVDEKSVVGYTVSKGETQRYEDAYNPPPGKPVGGKSFDAQFGYRTKSMLTVPMRNYNNEVVGAVQLINAKRRLETRLTKENVEEEVVSFHPDDDEMLESVASQAAVAIDNKTLLKDIEELFDQFVTASVYAIEQRDPSTAGHSGRVEALTTKLADEVTRIEVGKYRDVVFSKEQLKELRYACLLHDFGKIGVREDILVKEKKLFPFQLDLIQWRFDSVERWAQLRAELEAKRGKGVDPARAAEIERRLEAELDQYRKWFEAIAVANEPSVLPEDKASTLSDMKGHDFPDVSGRVHPLIAPQEFHFLSIQKGTLTNEERKEIESHVAKSHDFLNKIQWTKLSPLMGNIPEIAWGHHEKLDGSGYPRGLKGNEIPTQTRMMTISDIYDALTARDRPYKPAIPTSAALDILNAEAGRGQLDPDLLDVFIARRVYDVTASS
ncbi:MAG TPA: HD domain-containing phosphohydrolase [Candidatus Dormibacteraeota bacterium]|jgi:HD-GYP domain-containing protein (c-di-GMP phosphodiesterase class II)|nr:HD domain-containing phosphohydrolase [Candidatus Dormibacteraeota bacterium]